MAGLFRASGALGMLQIPPGAPNKTGLTCIFIEDAGWPVFLCPQGMSPDSLPTFAESPRNVDEFVSHNRKPLRDQAATLKTEAG
jgi:hypothetical protein